MSAAQEGATARSGITPFEFAALAYLALPTALFFLIYAILPVALGVAGALVFALWLCLRLIDRGAPLRLGALDLYFIAFAAAVVFLSGSFGGGIFPTQDWRKHFAVFQFLIDNDTLTGSPGNSERVSLSYYVGWYIVPALIAKFAGESALLPAIGGWSALGLYLFFRVAAQLGQSRYWRYALPPVFLLFSGADTIGSALSTFEGDFHLEWWIGWVQFSSMLTDIFWAPQHALSSWIGIALAIRLRKDPACLTVFPLVTASALLWSPFSAFGLAPFFIWSMLREVRAVRIQSVLNAFLMLGVCVLILDYLGSGRGNGYMTFATVFDQPCLAFTRTCYTPQDYLLFIGVEILGFLAILHFATKGRDPLLWIATVFLLILPFGRYGGANDLNLHASIAPLAVLAICCWQTLQAASKGIVLALGVLLIAGAATPFGEVDRALKVARGPAPGITLQRIKARRQYLVTESSWMMRD